MLISLADDDLVYKDDMREAGLPALLVSLFSVYQANQAAAELRPVAAQMLRCLCLMASGDGAMQDACAALGLIRLLVGQLHLDIHQLDEPPLPAAACNILSLNSLPNTPKSPHVSSGGSGGISAGGAFSSLPPASPLRRSGSGGSSPRPGSAGPGSRRGGFAEPSIPEDEEADVAAASSATGRQPGATLGGRGAAFSNHSSEAAALRGLGAGPSPLHRLAAALLLREVLRPVMSRSSAEVLLHGMMLPALHMKVRWCVSCCLCVRVGLGRVRVSCAWAGHGTVFPAAGCSCALGVGWAVTGWFCRPPHSPCHTCVTPAVLHGRCCDHITLTDTSTHLTACLLCVRPADVPPGCCCLPGGWSPAQSCC